MTLIKSLLLGSAAGLVVVGGAQAADLPTRKAAPAAEYVRICTVGGVVGWVMPGSDTCMKISGFITAQIEGGNLKTQWKWAGNETALAPGTPAKFRDALGYSTRVRLKFDTASNTAYGPLNGHFELQFNHSEGFDNLGQGGTDGGLLRAYVTWAGITAGKRDSFFAFFGPGDNYADLFGANRQSSKIPDLLAYTASFGGGFSATLSLEDATNGATPSNASGGGICPTWCDTTGKLTYAGMRVPDIVGSLDVKQGWGGAHIAGVYHRVDVTDVSGATLNKSGWAINGGVKFNLPSLSPKDDVYIQGFYSKNATWYGGLQDGMFGEVGQVNGNGMKMPTADAFYNGVSWATPTVWVFSAYFEHYFTPQFYVVPEFSYGQLKWKNAAGLLSPKSTSWILGGDFGWTPVTNLNFDLEVMYQNTKQSTPALYVGPPAWPSKSDGVATRLRITRYF